MKQKMLASAVPTEQTRGCYFAAIAPYNVTVELRLIPGLISSLLPDETRRGVLPDNCEPTAHDSALSGLAELLFSVSTLAWMYFHIVPAMINGYVGQASGRPGGEGAMVQWAGGVPVAYGMGLSALTGFLLRWQTFAAAYFAFEGTVRAFAGFGADQVVPTMPLFIVERAVQRGMLALNRLKLPPLVVDEWRTEGASLRVESCRPKADWHRSACIEFEETLYEVVEERAGSKQRPWVYRLQPAPAHKIVRGLRHYDPRDVLKD